MKYVNYENGLEYSTDICFGETFGSEPDTMVEIACWIRVEKGEACAAGSFLVAF